MSKFDDLASWIQDRLPDLIAKYDVPAAAVAVYQAGDVADSAAGILSTATGVEATADSVFQIGSITKLWTATLVMQLAGEGQLDIDDPVRRHLPEFRLADQSAADQITVRQLLCHTAGFEGDIFTDTGQGEDCLELFVATLHEVPQLFPPGEQFSYNNAGYCVLGRLVEVLRDKTFDNCVREYLLTPLGLTHAANGPYEAILFRAAVGHVRHGPDAEIEPAPVWAMARSNAPAGSMLAMRPRDLVTFAGMHMQGGQAPDGTEVLPPGTVAAMRQRQVELPYFGHLGNAWGLGWEVFDTPSGTIFGHDGSTIGQAAFLRVVPERDVAVALLTNGGDAIALYREVVEHVLEELADVTLPAVPTPAAEPERIDAGRYVGTYSAQVVDMVVSQEDDGRIWLEQIPKGIFAEMGEEPERKELVHYQGDSLIPLEGEDGMYLPHAFIGDDGTGRAKYLHIGRALRRADA